MNEISDFSLSDDSNESKKIINNSTLSPIK